MNAGKSAGGMAASASRRPRTSASHPLQIATLPVGPGAVGLTFCPGKQGDSLYGAPWARDLEMDLDAIQQWGAAMVITLVDARELQQLGVPALGDCVHSRGLRWHHRPIADLQAPDEEFMAAWPALSAEARRVMAGGQRVLVHCRGGLGRAGLVAACLLVDAGMTPAQAIAALRQVRPGAIETRAQEQHVLHYRPEAGNR